MHEFIEKFAPRAFDPEEVKILTQAFDDAWAKVQANKAAYLAEEYTLAGRTILAKHIINAAKGGERGPHRLADFALLYLSQQNLRRGDWPKVKNPQTPTVKREAEEDWGR